jgi:hypothetical protein
MLTQTNSEVADVLDRIAELFGAQDDVHRARAFRRGANAVRALSGSAVDLYRERGLTGLDAVPSIGKSIASVIAELVETGHCHLLSRLEGRISPEDLFATVPGVGNTLAHHIVLSLGIDSLEELELAAHDGRLTRVSGFGPRRARAVREMLASRLAHKRSPLALAAREPLEAPDAATILEVDADYRRRASRGELRTIAPRRFNPSGKAWLPVLHTERAGWAFTALFSNSARAHSRGRTQDWVVIFYEKDGQDGQCTVVTELQGDHAGVRVIRGREQECFKVHETSHDRPAFPPCPRCGQELDPLSWLPQEAPPDEEVICSWCRRAKDHAAASHHAPVPHLRVVGG